jgi:FixJ family two-component response regulator
MSGRRVLVVDDDVSVRRALERLLRAAGYAVETFASATEFLSRANAGPECLRGPACLVLDVRMPGQSGVDLYETLAGRGADVAVIFITGHGDVPMAEKARKAGAVDFLAKPFTEAALLAAIARVFPGGATRPGAAEHEDAHPVAERTLTRSRRGETA